METQKEHSLGYIDDSVCLPPMLASRTCAKIWATLDCNAQGCEPNSTTFLNSDFFSPETFLPHDFLLQTSEPEEIESPIPKTTRAVKKPEPRKIEIHQEPPQCSHWLGLIASVSVGIVIAFFLFPMVRHVERSTRSYMAESWMGEINRRVDQYEQIHGNSNNPQQIEALLPFNLALSGWQEWHPEVFLGFLLPPSASAISFEEEVDYYVKNTQSSRRYKNLPSEENTGQIIRRQISSGETGKLIEWDNLISSNNRIQLIIPMEGDMVRSAFGQGITIKDGRVFFRVSPNVETLRR